MTATAKLTRRAGIDRGRLITRFLEDTVRPLAGLDVLDLGCGRGEISTALAAAGARLVACDFNTTVLRQARERVEAADGEVACCATSAIELPFANDSFDVIVFNGVLEWVGKAAPHRDPEACQRQALTELHRVLRPGGAAYIAIENRTYPRWLIGDPHVRTPLVALLPRRVANLLHRLVTGQKYVTYIHSYSRLRQLVRDGGFRDHRVYVPIFHYRWPLRVVPIDDGRRIADEVRALRHELRTRDGVSSPLAELKFALYRWTAVLGLSRLFFPSFVVLARRA
jgi:ubiquinone/menaquinone biosynthesis C-methylase UbiE